MLLKLDRFTCSNTKINPNVPTFDMSTKIVIAIPAVILAAAAIAALMFQYREPPPLEFDDIPGISIISPPVPLDPVELIDANANAFSIDTLKNRWALVFFGFTHCPDICPTTLTSLKRSAQHLRSQLPPEEEPAYVFISLDPARDTPEVVKDYVSYFDPAFIGLTGDEGAIDRLAETVGVIYDYEGDIAGGDYLVNHYAAILVIDPQLRLRAHILPPHPMDKVTQAFTRIQDYYGN